MSASAEFLEPSVAQSTDYYKGQDPLVCGVLSMVGERKHKEQKRAASEMGFVGEELF